ncbi:hypothetical protein OS493_001111 [Desmophyllum pertusum]|uniref:Calponin-homology (CH) domain-containing protein n=1 Tax=Desmophyllum pertusum TaxID=174260 RepID=A0A9W9ZTS3_9CNID|nr:hypothetical protein OS493_001111 [Desmophyllum pertusum]
MVMVIFGTKSISTISSLSRRCLDGKRKKMPYHRDAVQKKTFTKWINNHLQKPRERGQLRFHRLQNVQTALEYLQSQQVKLVNIRSEDIVDGNPKLTLGLIWTIILHFQISEVEVVGKQEQMTAKDALLLWAQKVTQGYPSVGVGNFTSSWKDGLAFNAIIHRYRPDLVDFSKLSKASPEQNLEYSFHVAEKELGVPRLLDVEGKAFKFEEYCNLAKALVVDINRVINRLEKQRFPKAVHGIKELIVDYNRYRITEFPDMEASRHSLKMVFRELQALYGPMATWLEFPFECSPRELEVSWTKLVETQDNYNKSLRIELTRLEQMSQVAEKIQKEATLVDASLDDIEDRIKSEEEVGDTIDNETRRKHFYQIEKSLVMFESSIKHMISGVDILIAGRYSRADELRIKIQSIERRWSEMKDRLDVRSTKMLTYQTFSTTDGKKMKLELPVEKTVVSTEETTPTSDDPDEIGVRTRRKVITITKRTYRSSGTPTETRTTVARIMSAEGLDDESNDNGASPRVVLE